MSQVPPLSRLSEVEKSSLDQFGSTDSLRLPSSGQPLHAFRIPLPSLEDRVRAYTPELGHKASFLDSFPPEVQTLILDTLRAIIRERSPLADDSRESNILVLPPGESAPDITKELNLRVPLIYIKFPKGADQDVIRKLLAAPNLAAKSSKRYKGLIEAKLARGRNSKSGALPLVSIFQFDLLRQFFISGYLGLPVA